jgi:glycosyltransferase involved in cell wall biosynthesis
LPRQKRVACWKARDRHHFGGPKFFVDESNGILIEPGNQAQLDDAMVYMLSHYQDYDRGNCAPPSKRKFSPEAVSRQFIQVYQEAM